MFDHLGSVEAATPQACRKLVDDLASRGAKSAALLVGQNADIDLEAVVSALDRTPIPIIGGVFPELFRGEHRFDRGALAMGFAEPGRRIEINELAAPRSTLEVLVGRLFASPRNSGDHTVVLFLDGQHGGSVGELLRVFQLHFQANANYIGAGAGRVSFDALPCLFTEERVLPPGAGLALRLDRATSVTVEHGWSRFDGPYFVSRAEGSVIHELDWQKAADVYRGVLERAGLHPDLSSPSFPEDAALFPLGLPKFQDIVVVRDIVAATEDGAIRTLGDVPEHSVLDVLTGKPDALLQAAAQAARNARNKVQAPKSAFIADCVSRPLALGNRFSEELHVLSQTVEGEVAGALTLGEIASQGARLVEFFNKTVVVGVG